MTKYKYEFEYDYFEKGDCFNCPLSYQTYDDQYEEWNDVCVLNYSSDECPLEEVG